MTRVKYPPPTNEKINDNQKHLQVAEEIKQRKVPRIDLIPKFNYPKHIPNLNPFQCIMIKDLEIVIGQKYDWDVNVSIRNLPNKPN